MTPQEADLMLGLFLLFPTLMLFCFYEYLMEYSGMTYMVGEAILDMLRRIFRDRESGGPV